MSAEREYERLFKLAQKQLQSARTSIESAEVFLDAAMDAVSREAGDEEAKPHPFEFPAFGGGGFDAVGGGMPDARTRDIARRAGYTVPGLTREMIRSRTAAPADATGVAKPPTPSDTE